MLKSPDRTPILLLATKIAIGGAEKLLLTQASWLHEHGYDVKAVFFYDQQGLLESWTKEYGFPIQSLGAWRADGFLLQDMILLVRGLTRLLRLFREHKFGAIETFTQHSNLLGLPIAWLMGVPVRVATHHGRIENFSAGLNFLHRLLINSRITSCMVAVSEYVRSYAMKVDGIRPDKIRVILNGITFAESRIDRAAARAYVTEKLGMDPKALLIFSAGRLRLQKGYGHLINAAPAVLRKFPQAVFMIAGEGIMRSHLENMISRLNLERSVRLLGNRADVPVLLAATDLFVLPSLWEGLPLALLEALSAGCAVVASDVEGVREILVDYHAASFAGSEDSDALANAILSLLEHEDERRALAQRGVGLAQKYSSENMCRQYESLIRELAIDLKN